MSVPPCKVLARALREGLAEHLIEATGATFNSYYY